MTDPPQPRRRHDRGCRAGSTASGDVTADCGSASILALAFAMVFLVAAAAVVLAGSAIAARHRAATAADLSALAGAAALTRLPAEPRLPAELRLRACAAARAVAGANGATLTSCDVAGSIVSVTVVIELRALPGQPQVSARARAGPR